MSKFWTEVAGIADMQAETSRDLPAGKGRRFTKVYPRGVAALAGLIDHPAAAKVFLFFVENCGHDNAIVCTYDTLSEALEMSERTIRRAVRLLEDRDHVVIAKLGTANAYILNPEEVWKTYEDHKIFCQFTARAVVSKTANGNLKKRLTHVLGKPEQADLLD